MSEVKGTSGLHDRYIIIHFVNFYINISLLISIQNELTLHRVTLYYVSPPQLHYIVLYYISSYRLALYPAFLSQKEIRVTVYGNRDL